MPTSDFKNISVRPCATVWRWWFTGTDMELPYSHEDGKEGKKESKPSNSTRECHSVFATFLFNRCISLAIAVIYDIICGSSRSGLLCQKCRFHYRAVPTAGRFFGWIFALFGSMSCRMDLLFDAITQGSSTFPFWSQRSRFDDMRKSSIILMFCNRLTSRECDWNFEGFLITSSRYEEVKSRVNHVHRDICQIY